MALENLSSSVMWFVYLLRCADDTIYVGCTSDLEERLKRHNGKEVPATKLRLPVDIQDKSSFYKVFSAIVK